MKKWIDMIFKSNDSPVDFFFQKDAQFNNLENVYAENEKK